MKRRVSSRPFSSHGNPILLVIKVAGWLEMPFFLAAGYAAVGLDFSVRIEGRQDGSQNICIYDVASGQRTRLTFEKRIAQRPVWAPVAAALSSPPIDWVLPDYLVFQQKV